MKVLKLIGVNSLVLFVLLILLELLLRALGMGYGSAPLESDTKLHHINPSNYSFKCYSPDNEFGGHMIYFDQFGRRVENNDVEKETKKKEIWFLGDSFTASIQVKWEDSFVGIVNSRENYHAINFGVSSYSPILYAIRLREELKKQKPEMVFIQLYSNDVSDDKMYEEHTSFDENGIPVHCNGGTPNNFVKFLRKFYLVRSIRKLQLTIKYLAQKNTSHSKTKELVVGAYRERSEPVESDSRFAKSVLHIESILKQNDIPHYFFAIPSKYSCITDDWTTNTFSKNFIQFAKNNKLPFISLEESFKDQCKEEPLFYEKDIHCNEKGNLVIAKKILEEII